MFNSPAVHPRISFSEKQYIQKSIGHDEEKVACSNAIYFFLNPKGLIKNFLDF